MKAVPLSRYLVFFLIAAGGCATDLSTKRWAFDRLGDPWSQQGPWWVWPGVLGFQTSLNEGALFGMGQGMVKVFAVLSIVAAIAVFWWLFRAGAAREWLLTIALGCITAGIFGNLYDRLGMPGLVWQYNSPHHLAGEPVYAVRDWIHVMIGRWPWPTFNIADSLLVCGAAMLFWHAFRGKPRQETAAGTAKG